MQLENFLEESHLRFPDKTALVFEGNRLSYREVETLCNRLAHGLMAHGVERGDRVVIYLDNSAEAVLSIFAVLKAGAVFVPVNPTTKSDKLAFILNHSRAKALITRRQKSSIVQSLGDTLCLQTILMAGEETGAPHGDKRIIPMKRLFDSGAPSTPPPKRCIDIDLAALIYTSGSTGIPKGVMLTHLNMTTAADSITRYLENGPDDIILNVLPLSFDYGLYQILMGFKVGATVVLERSFTHTHVVLNTLSRERVTGFPIVPTISAILLQLDLKKYDLSSLRYITSTGAALPASHITSLRALLPEVRIFSMYGLTECKRVSYLPPDQIDHRPDSVGKGMPNEEIFIVDEKGEPAVPGTVGELVVRGAHVMKGYWELPEETDCALRPGPFPGEKVLYTGDLFRIDAEGYLYFVGRKDDIIKSRGEKVSPKEIENVLYNFPGIAEAAVVGLPDPVLGQALKAIVTPREGAVLPKKEILHHCKKYLEDFMVPQQIEIRASLPRTATGKISKRDLLAPAMAPEAQD